MNVAAVKSDKHFTLKIISDEDAASPRENDNLGKMVCFHGRYSLGDENEFKTNNDFLVGTVQYTVPAQDVIALVKAGKAEGLTLSYDRSTREWELKSYSEQFKKWYTEYTAPAPLDMKDEYLFNAILEEMQTADLLSLVERTNVIMPLYLYDHSGITMSTGPFNDPWDSGQVGWIYVSHEDIAKTYGDASPANIEKVTSLLTAEVKEYDHYLQGDCYGFQLFKDGEEIDSCWGFIGDFDDVKLAIREHLPQEAAHIADIIEYGDTEPEKPGRKPSLLGQLQEKLDEVKAAATSVSHKRADVSL